MCRFMDHPLISLIDQAIAKAEAEGAFDNLPGAGKPLDTSRDPMDALVEKARQEAGVTSPLAELKRQVAEAEAALNGLTGEALTTARKDLSSLRLKLALEIEAVQKHG